MSAGEQLVGADRRVYCEEVAENEKKLKLYDMKMTDPMEGCKIDGADH